MAEIDQGQTDLEPKSIICKSKIDKIFEMMLKDTNSVIEGIKLAFSVVIEFSPNPRIHQKDILSISQDYHEIKAEIESGKASLGETRKYRKELSGELIDILQDILNHYFPDQARQAA